MSIKEHILMTREERLLVAAILIIALIGLWHQHASRPTPENRALPHAELSP